MFCPHADGFITHRAVGPDHGTPPTPARTGAPSIRQV